MLTRLFRRNSRRRLAWLLIGSMSLPSLSGCSRQFWRKQADRDSYNAIGERLNDPRWNLPRVEMTPDPRSRFFDPYDPDKEPLPPDDPAAHEFMHCVNGRRGYKNWHKLGTSFALENPQWLSRYGISMDNADPVYGHSQVVLEKLTVPDLMDLAYIHSREYQTNIEDLYLSALDLTAERFRLGVRYLGVTPAEPGATLGTNLNRRGKPTGTGVATFGVSQLLPTGGQIAVEVANSLTWIIDGPGHVSAPSIGYSFTQPLLFNAGRKIALEPLTQAERTVLYGARTLARFRQTLFASVAQQYLSLIQQKQGILNAQNNIRLLEEQIEAQEIRDARLSGLVSEQLDRLPAGALIPDNLKRKLTHSDGWLKWRGTMSEDEEAAVLAVSADPVYQAAAQQLIIWKKQKATALTSLQLIGRLNTGLNNLQRDTRAVADALDDLKLALGLPPNIQLDVDESILKQFALIRPELIALEKKLRDVQQQLGERLLPSGAQNQGAAALPPDFETLRLYLDVLSELQEELRTSGLERTREDFAPLEELLEATREDWKAQRPGKRFFREEEDRETLQTRMERDRQLFELRERDFEFGRDILDLMRNAIAADSMEGLLQKLDTNGDGFIQLNELPEGWSELPRQGIEVASEKYTVDDLLSEIRDAARVIRDKYILAVAQGLEVIQAGLRVEAIPVIPFQLEDAKEFPDVEKIIQIGLENRHDLMNSRARVMDARRRVEIQANALESGLDIRFSGTQGLNPDGRANTAHNATLRFTTPMDQVLERNNYREALINYQRERRNYMAAEDQIKRALRDAWRQLRVQEYRLEIDRASVRNAALQYDNASLQAATATQTGGGGTGGQNNALSLIQALDSVLQAQNSLVGDWVTYERNRLNIYRDMGIMQIDPRGVWTDPFYQQISSAGAEPENSSPAATPDVVLPLPEPQN